MKNKQRNITPEGYSTEWRFCSKWLPGHCYVVAKVFWVLLMHCYQVDRMLGEFLLTQSNHPRSLWSQVRDEIISTKVPQKGDLERILHYTIASFHISRYLRPSHSWVNVTTIKYFHIVFFCCWSNSNISMTFQKSKI